MFYIFPETCKIVLDSNNKEYTVCINQLEINGMPPRAVDLDIGTKVVWIHKGRNLYAAEVLQEPSGMY